MSAAAMPSHNGGRVLAIHPPPLRFVSLADLEPASEPDWVWPGYVARDFLTLLTGVWKGGKTTLIAHLLRDLYRGSHLVETPIEWPTLVLSEETSGLWSQRTERLGLDPRIQLAKRDRFTPPSLVEWCDIIELTAETVRAEGAGLVVLDTLAGLWCVQNENDAAEVTAALTPIRAICEAGAAVLVTHHPSKGAGGGIHAGRGSSAIQAVPDLLVTLSLAEPDDANDTRRVLTARGRFEGTPSETVIELTEGGFEYRGPRSEIKRADVSATIAAILDASEIPLSVAAIREHWPEGPKPGETALRSALAEGEASGLWFSSGAGKRGDPLRYAAARPPASPKDGAPSDSFARPGT